MNRLLPPYLLNGPALVLFVTMLAVPLIMTFMLSFNSFEFYGGIKSDFGWHNYYEVVSDNYFHKIFARTYAIAIVVTLFSAIIGVPEAYILYRMGSTWRSLCLLAILGPLLISVIVRTLGWALLIGSKGVINEALIGIGLIETPDKNDVYHDQYRGGPGACAGAFHGVVGVDDVTETGSAGRASCAFAGSFAIYRSAQGGAAAGDAGCAGGLADRICTDGQRLCDSGHTRGTTPESGCDHCLR